MWEARWQDEVIASRWAIAGWFSPQSHVVPAATFFLERQCARVSRPCAKKPMG